MLLWAMTLAGALQRLARPAAVLAVIVLSQSLAGCQLGSPPLEWPNVQEVALPEPFSVPVAPAMSPDGKYLAVFGSVDSREQAGQVVVWDTSAQSWSAAEIDGRYYHANSLGWSSDATSLVFYTEPAIRLFYPENEDLVSMPLDGESVLPFWGPGPNQLTLFSGRGWHLDMLSLADNTREMLLELPEAPGRSTNGADWSFDGTHLLLALANLRAEGTEGVYLYDSGVDRLTTIAEGDYFVADADWAPDGSWFVYVETARRGSPSKLVFVAKDLSCRLAIETKGGLWSVDWWADDQLVLVYSTKLYQVDMRQSFGFGFEELGSHCEQFVVPAP